MKFLKISLILSALGIFAFACTQNAPTNNAAANNSFVAANSGNSQTAAPADELAEAREIYSRNCVGCHKENGTGGEKILDNGEKINVPNYKSQGAMNASDDKLYDYIANGEDGEMPAFKTKLSEAQMRSLVKFIRKEFQGK
jgi:Cytochrome c, mono- and diheme variants